MKYRNLGNLHKTGKWCIKSSYKQQTTSFYLNSVKKTTRVYRWYINSYHYRISRHLCTTAFFSRTGSWSMHLSHVLWLGWKWMGCGGGGCKKTWNIQWCQMWHCRTLVSSECKGYHYAKNRCKLDTVQFGCWCI